MRVVAKFEKLLCSINVKRFLISILVGVATVGYASEYSEKTHAEIADSLVRFHVVANSDSEYDQQLKLKVRDGVAEYMRDRLAGAQNVKETKSIINASLDGIKTAAEKVLESNGSNYSVAVETGVFQFPTKVYVNTKLPAGKYYALRVIIGEGKGKNWWCVLYPEFCFGEVDTRNLKNVLTEDAYNIVTDSDGDIEYKFKFRILELFGK